MPTFDFTVKIDAANREEAHEIMLSMLTLMKTIRRESSIRDFIDFAAKLQAKPSLVRKAKMFI